MKPDRSPIFKKNILVTGRPGCGKSTLIEKIAAGIKVRVTGFFTREVREKGKRVGFSLETLDGKRATLAHVGLKSSFRVGTYGVNVKALEETAIPSFRVLSTEVLIIIDEIGKMECFSHLFKQAVVSVLDSPNPVLASIAERGDSFIESIKSRDDVALHRIDVSNRDHLATAIEDEMKTLIKQGK